MQNGMSDLLGRVPNWACCCVALVFGVATSVGGLVWHLGIQPLGLFGMMLTIILPYVGAILCNGKRRLLWITGALLAQVLTATVLFIALVSFGRAFG
jgi:nitric oxide reductase large subunit